jgi:protein-S-isoprenylcysteine O-methyltransferase Ste14
VKRQTKNSLCYVNVEKGHHVKRSLLLLMIWLGLVLFAIGFFFEDSGVWRYTRHPNYFGDARLWWGFYCLAVASGGAWTGLSALVMTGLLLKVSGVVMLEKRLIETKPKYRDYVARTSSFIPWPPKQ